MGASCCSNGQQNNADQIIMQQTEGSQKTSQKKKSSSSNDTLNSQQIQQSNKVASNYFTRGVAQEDDDQGERTKNYRLNITVKDKYSEGDDAPTPGFPQFKRLSEELAMSQMGLGDNSQYSGKVPKETQSQKQFAQKKASSPVYVFQQQNSLKKMASNSEKLRSISADAEIPQFQNSQSGSKKKINRSLSHRGDDDVQTVKSNYTKKSILKSKLKYRKLQTMNDKSDTDSMISQQKIVRFDQAQVKKAQ